MTSQGHRVPSSIGAPGCWSQHCTSDRDCGSSWDSTSDLQTLLFKWYVLFFSIVTFIHCLIHWHFVFYCHGNLWHDHISSLSSNPSSPWCSTCLTNPTQLPITTLRYSSRPWSCRVSLPIGSGRMSHQPPLSHSVNPALQPFSSAHCLGGIYWALLVCNPWGHGMELWTQKQSIYNTNQVHSPSSAILKSKHWD